MQSTDLWGNPTESSSGFACGTEASGSDKVSEPEVSWDYDEASGQSRR